MVDAFKVDGIPHIAFLDPSNEVKTALVGAVPKQILDKEISSLVQVSAHALLLDILCHNYVF